MSDTRSRSSGWLEQAYPLAPGRPSLAMQPATRPEPPTRPAGAWPRSILRRLPTRPPAIAWTFALLLVLKALVGLTTVAFPLSPEEPLGLVALIGVAGVLAGAAIWVLGARIPLLGFELLAAGGSLTTSFLIAHAATPGGMMVAAFSYPWIAIYAAHFFPRRAVLAQGLLISLGFGLGLLSDGLPDAVVYWLMVTATSLSICLLLGNLSESMRRQAGTDHLTGLLNRNGFLSAALRERALADRTGEALTLVVVDLDGFKQINDRYGHAAGDRLLAGLGRDWRARMRPCDILARYGGDEFVLLLPATTPTGARAMLERLRMAEGVLSWSVGVSEWLPGEALDAPIARADRYLYGVKSAQRGQAGEAAELVYEVDGASEGQGATSPEREHAAPDGADPQSEPTARGALLASI